MLTGARSEEAWELGGWEWETEAISLLFVVPSGGTSGPLKTPLPFHRSQLSDGANDVRTRGQSVG